MEGDASLAGTRTQLAWRRTATGFVVLALIELRHASSNGVSVPGAVFAVLALVAGAALLVLTSTGRPHPFLLTSVALFTLTGVVVQEVWPRAG